MDQGRKSVIALIAAIVFGAASLGQAVAAPINLQVGYPDLTTFGATISYTYVAVCARSSGQVSTCGGQYTIPRWDLTYGRLTISGNVAQALNPDGSGLLGVTDVNGAASNYNLTVILGFNSTGTALSGILASDPWSGDALYTSSLAAYGTTIDPDFQSGTLITGSPTNATAYGYPYAFGYSGSGAAGTFEFVADNLGGDFANFGNVASIIVSTTNLTAAVGNWDSLGISFWKTAHSGTANVDTFVPVPAAAWLMGSGLITLLSVRLARRHKEVSGARGSP